MTTATVAETSLAGFPALRGTPTTQIPTNPPILFLHGAFADHYGFQKWVQWFADRGYETYAPARRGRLGIGPDHAAGLDFDDYIDDTNAVIAEIGRPPVIVGHSLGALLAQRLAEQGKAAAIALLAPAPPAMLTAQPIALPKFAPQMPKILSGRPFIVANDACSVLALNRVPEELRPPIHARLTHESGKVYRALMFGSIRVDAAKVTVPVFVGSGTEDRIISAKLARKTAEHYGCPAHIYPDHAHWIIDEPGTEQVMQDVADWLRTADLAVSSESRGSMPRA
ncbi:alpha/beta hydrolase [Nocardia seriolae]|uniref:Alpha/beta hydrolase n=1 Tax=Nocardia seriolae TaxID=37332 RepID=A0A0B8NFE7_9NOCA|nr:alpha/beta hydrolase [Nocardia seriolae]APB01600.1 Carboxylesterase [Nocardia seriolae]MTJ60926.1 alpha/beta fold hydrolase [Nocardia seriolae]MTJ75291.1 alpha/beta fold hydrolase [Nocardia seriolae]MTJ90939.1 alpha/beta fold hydrolase [Nocardia seriolae]MTK34896.1 alpha/beta fold hydrolase [Nocardia seriolae]